MHNLVAGDSICVPGNARHGAKTIEGGTLIDVFTPVREDLLRGHPAVPRAANPPPAT